MATQSTASSSRKLSSDNRQLDTIERRTSMELPERFQVDDSEEDAAKPDESHPETFIQQSMYGIFAAAQNQGEIRPDFQLDSGSDSETDSAGSRRNSRNLSQTANRASVATSRREEQIGRPKRGESSRHRMNKSEGNILKSGLRSIRERSDSQSQDAMTQSQFLPPKETTPGENDQVGTPMRQDASILDLRLQAQARAEAGSPALSVPQSGSTTSSVDAGRPKPPVTLPKALAEIFQFDEPEELISEYRCWYLQSVLLQGFMYVTQKHVCFYAYLQKKGIVAKTGHLTKQGKRTSRYRRYWCKLKGNNFSYFASAADPYFPIGSIDLRHAITAELAAENDQEKNKEWATFIISTDKRVYSFRADSAPSAKEWVRQLQKVIFRSRNDGDSVKICLPLGNIVDVEPTSAIELADTVMLRVVDSNDSFAVDEYFFTFFQNGKDALNVLSMMTEGNDVKKAEVKTAEEDLAARKAEVPSFRRSASIDRSRRISQTSAAAVQEGVRSTVSPASAGGPFSPDRSGEQTRRSSTEVPRPSFERGRKSFDKSKKVASATSQSSSRRRNESNSPVSTSGNNEDSYLSSSSNADGTEDDMSASQMLTGNAVFASPTLGMPQAKRTTSGPTVDQPPKQSGDSSLRSQGIAIPSSSMKRTGQSVTDRPSTQLSSDQELQVSKLSAGGASTSLAGPKRAIITPLQHAFTFAGAVRDRGKQMTSYLSGSPKSYYDKFSGAIAGGKHHYSQADGLSPDDHVGDAEEDMNNAEDERRFQEHFALPTTEKLRAVHYCWLHRVLPLYGKIYMSDQRFCFRSLIYGTRTKLVLPFKEIVNAAKETGFRWGYPGMVLVIKGHEELFFDFGSHEVRDDCVITILRALDVMKTALESVILTKDEKAEADDAAAEHELLQDARKDSYGRHDHKLPSNIEQQLTGRPMIFDDPTASLLDFRPKKPLRITCLTIGSRGDIQPYIALCKGLMAHGHHTKIATHATFKNWVEENGIEFAPVEGDPAELMRMCVENGMFTPSFILETSTTARGWLDELLVTSWKACQNSDLLIESPSAMGGIHIAEALEIPYFRAFGMPWTKTRAYPHAFATTDSKWGGKWNYSSYLLFDMFFWTVISGQINRWRRKTLHIGPTDLGKLQQNKVPFLYNFSPSVVVPPLDFSDWIRVTGYWFLDGSEGKEWTPKDSLVAFIKKARDDGKKLVYIGFGSVPVSDSKQLTQHIVDAVLEADVRCIFVKGWSDHFDKKDEDAPALPPAVYQIASVPHDWLFKQIDAAVHHGGSGTTGASLRAGLPTIIKPFFGDQYFFASRVEDLGVGLHIKKVTAITLGKAMWVATRDERMRTKARMLSEQIRQENGVETAINAIYRDLEYAKSLIKKRSDKSDPEPADEEDDAESWTFVENASDVDVTGGRRTSQSSWYKHGKLPSLRMG